jgi:hypothetical protein
MYHRFLLSRSTIIFTASLASRCWTAAIGVGAGLHVLTLGGIDPRFNGFDDARNGTQGIETEDRVLGFFMFISI